MANPTLLNMPIARDGNKNTIPTTDNGTTGLLSQQYGWQLINAIPPQQGGKAVKREDFNGALYLLSNILFYAQKGWQWEFDETQNYFAGCTVKDTVDGKIYVCIADVNASTTHPSADTTHWKLSDLNASVPDMIHSAAMHNGLYRGKDLTSYFESGDMSAKILDGSFDNIYIGDYITKAITVDGTTYNVKWEVAHLDYFLHSGEPECVNHHALMFPSGVVQTSVPMNTTNTTVGGYTGSKMWTDTIPLYDAAIKAAFGDTHVLSHSELLSNSIDANAAAMGGAGRTGAANNWEWKDVISNIPSEPMIYGGTVWGSSGYDVGNKERQLAIFKFKKYCTDRRWFWLQAVGSSSAFAYAYYLGDAYLNVASYSTIIGGIRPYFLLR